jgi:integrase/recombinase XerD
MAALPPITNAQSDRELILIWMADKSRTTQASFKGTVAKFLEFIDKPLVDVRIEDLGGNAEFGQNSTLRLKACD